MNTFGGRSAQGYQVWGSYPQQQSYAGGGMFGGMGFLLGGAALGLGWLFSRRKDSQAQQAQSPDIFQNLPTLTPTPDPLPITTVPLIGIGGVRDRIKPQWTGVQNSSNKGGPLPRAYGKFKMYPETCAEVITVQEGNDTYLLALYTFGHGPLSITQLQVAAQDIANFPEIQYELVQDSLTDPAITLYTQDIAQQAIGQALKYNVPVIQTAPQAADKLSIDIACNNGLYLLDSNNVKQTASVSFDIEYRLANTGNPWVKLPPLTGAPSNPSITISGADGTVLRGNRNWTVTNGLYEVRITRLTIDATNPLLINTTSWETFRAFRNTPPVLLDKFKDAFGAQFSISLLAIKAKATDRLNGTLGQISAMVEAKLSTYAAGVWGPPVITHSPAWAIADSICGSVNLRAMPRTALSGDDFLQLANYCAANNIEFNAIYDSDSTCLGWIKQMTYVGRSTLDLKDDKVSVLIDKERSTVVMHFTPENIVKDSFSGDWRRPRMPHGLKMTFINPNANWEQDTVYVYADGRDSSNSWLFQEVPLFGCTSSDQAWKLGRKLLADLKLRRRTFTWITDIANLQCTRNDLVRLTHPAALIGVSPNSAEITSVTVDGSGNALSITTNESFTLEAGQQYGIQGMRLDGTIFDADIVPVSVTTQTNSLTFVAPIAALICPDVGGRIAFGVNGFESLDLVIDSIEYLDNDSARISAVDHAPAVYQAENGTIPPFVSGITLPHEIQQTVPVPVITRIQSDETVMARDTDGSYHTRILIELQPAPATVQYGQVQVKRSDSTQWSSLQVFGVSNGQVSINNVEDGIIYDIRLRYVSTRDMPSDFTYQYGYTVIGKLTPPNPVDRLFLVNGLFQWDKATLEPDFAGYRAKVLSGTSRNWAAATVVANLTVNNQFDSRVLPSGTISFGVAVVDTAGLESSVAWYTTDMGDPPIDNVLAITTSEPTFPGTITDGTVSGGVLQANDTGGLFWRDSATTFWSPTPSDVFWQNAYKELVYTRTFVPDSSLLTGGDFYISLDVDIVGDYIIEFKTGGLDAFWAPVLTTPFWKSDPTIFWLDDVYSLWPGRIKGSYQEYSFRVTVTSPQGVRGQINKFDIVIDVPDVEEVISNILIPVGGTRLPITKQFRNIVNITYGVRYDATYPNIFTARIIDREPVLGPLVKAYDTSGAETQGYTDWLLKGY